MKRNNMYIGTIIKGEKIISKSNQKVIFKVDDKVYIKKIKEKNKIRINKYVLSENANIICNDLNDEYVYIASDNQPYFNKILLALIVFGIYMGILATSILTTYHTKYFLPTSLCLLFLFVLLILYLYYVVLWQPKKICKKYTKTTYGEIINYSRTEYRHDRNKTFHCKYNIMYKYKTPDGKIIHSVVSSNDAKLLYKDYPLNKKVLIKYNPSKYCESCLLDEYNCIYNKKKFVKHSSFTIMTIGIITNISTKCIDEDVEDYLKKYYLVDYIECEYDIADKKYRTNSVFSVPHNRFRIGEKIRIFYEKENPNIFFCDINKNYSKADTIDF